MGSTWDLTVEDIHVADAAGARRDGRARGQEARARDHASSAPTSTVSIEGRPVARGDADQEARPDDGPVPLWAEVAFAAVEDFTHGTAVVDGVMLGIGLTGQVKEPITWTIEGGKCVSIEGGEEADEAARPRSTASRTRPCSASSRSARATRRPSARPRRRAASAPSTSRSATTTTPIPGGQNVCSLHLDGVFLNATMQIVDDGTLHPEGRRMGDLAQVGRRSTTSIRSSCPNGSWSRMLVTDGQRRRQRGSLGYSVFTPGTTLAPVRHETEEFAYVVSGQGELLLDDGALAFAAGRRAATSRAASGTRSRTRATRTWSWCSGSRIRTIRRPSAAADDGRAVAARAGRLGVAHPRDRGLRGSHARARQRPRRRTAASTSSARASRSTRWSRTTSSSSRSTTPTACSRPTCTSRPCSTRPSTRRGPTSARSCTGIRPTRPRSARPTRRSSCSRTTPCSSPTACRVFEGSPELIARRRAGRRRGGGARRRTGPSCCATTACS